jgi:transposase
MQLHEDHFAEKTSVRPAFSQLGDFIVYKARRAGVPVVFVELRRTRITAPQ